MSRPSDDDRKYKVGFGRPPEEHQFKKGRSGNPSGKRRNPAPSDETEHPSLQSQLLAAGQTQMKVTVGGKVKRMSRSEALAEKLYHDGLTGTTRDGKLLAKLQLDAERDARNGRSSEPIRVIITGGLPERD